MSRKGKPYPKEFRRKIVELAKAGRPVSELAEEFEPAETTIYEWIKQTEIDAGERDDGPTTDEKEELKRLRRENRQLKQEREILKKAAAWFAQETTPTTNSGSSNS